MGLTDEAIGEFQLSARDERLHSNSCSMLGLCFREKGIADQAVRWYRQGIDRAGNGDEEHLLGLRYDLAELFMETGELEEALAQLNAVFGTNSKFRDVRARLRQVEKALAD